MSGNELVTFEPNLPVTEAGILELKNRRELLSKFVKNQMRIDTDFGIIPGCKVESLFKPGAEKLARLFGIGSRIVDKEKEFDLDANFAVFSYTLEAYHLATGTILAQLEGSCNSQEKKYRERTVYQFNKAKRKNEAVYKDGQPVKEPTPISDIRNTLQKMAQKRAYVGLIIQAVGASDFYTHDIDDLDDAFSLGVDPESKTRPPKRATATRPNTKNAFSCNENLKDVAPACCGKAMMINKFNPEEWYCYNCKSKKPKVNDIGKAKTEQSKPENQESDQDKRAQIGRKIVEKRIKMGITPEVLKKIIYKRFKKKYEELTIEDYEVLLGHLTKEAEECAS